MKYFQFVCIGDITKNRKVHGQWASLLTVPIPITTTTTTCCSREVTGTVYTLTISNTQRYPPLQ